MALAHDEWVSGIRTLVEAVGHEHERAEPDRTTPELGEQLTVDPQVLDVLRVLRKREGRNRLVERDGASTALTGLIRTLRGVL